jgi:hypothetical protein
MKRVLCIALLATLTVLVGSCSEPPAENPFRYDFIKPLNFKREPGKPYSEYQAIYILTEDFEPTLESPEDFDSIKEVLTFASNLSRTYRIPWTHFIDANSLARHYVSEDLNRKLRCQQLIDSLKWMIAAGDDCELHLHSPLDARLVEKMKSDHRIRLHYSVDDAEQPYRQRRSFFFRTYRDGGYRELVSSLAYGRGFLEQALYDRPESIRIFRPGGWDHGNDAHDTLLYFHALWDAGLRANSGLSTGDFDGKNWRVGNDPGLNLAKFTAGETTITEISPTAGPGGYVNPVLPNDLGKLAKSAKEQMPVIVSVYHLGSIQARHASDDESTKSQTDLKSERDALAVHFKRVAELVEARVLYPMTMREFLEILAERAP